jgi:uncharacterized protein (TIGR00730 family)
MNGASRFRRLCVYCGASKGSDPAYAAAARELGQALAQRGITLVYGGGRIGLMGEVADAALAAGGQVIGVIPEKLYKAETAHTGLSELIVADSMHSRKAIMAHLSDGFITLPGGWGTLEELFEMSAWAQLRFHGKPIGVLNVRGYFDPLLTFLEHASAEGFAHPGHAVILRSASHVVPLLAAMEVQ